MLLFCCLVKEQRLSRPQMHHTLPETPYQSWAMPKLERLLNFSLIKAKLYYASFSHENLSFFKHLVIWATMLLKSQTNLQ